MHDLNTAAKTEETSGPDNTTQNKDFEVNMIIKEFEQELLLQVYKENMRARVCCGIFLTKHCEKIQSVCHHTHTPHISTTHCFVTHTCGPDVEC